MNIAFYAPLKAPDHETPSGDRRMADLLLTALKVAGHDPHIASRLRSYDSAGNPSRQAEIRDTGIDEAAALADRYEALSADQRPAAWFTYHLYHKAPDWIGPAVCAALKIPYLVAEASVAAKHADGPWADGQAACVSAIRRAGAVLSLNDDDDEAVLPLLDNSDRLIPLKPFLDPAPYRTVRDGPYLTVRDGDGGTPCRLLAVAMMREGDKLTSYRALADALARLGGRDWCLTLVGDGPARRQVEAAFSGFDAGRVRFADEQSEASLPGFYADADLYVWPAVNEAYGMALLEAQASGLAVVAGRVRGVPGIVSHGETGLLVPGDGDFTEALGQLIDDETLRARLGRSAAATVAADPWRSAGRRSSRSIGRSRTASSSWSVRLVSTGVTQSGRYCG